MNLAQTMIAMERAGCSAGQMAAVALDHESQRANRRAHLLAYRAIEAALLPPEMNDAAIAANIDDASGQPEMNNAAIVVSDAAPQEGRHPTIARACEALTGAAHLTATQVRVALALIGRFNRTTGRCDPGHDTVGADANCSARTARRAIQKLAGLGLIGIVLHGGRFHANAYRLDWDAMIALPQMNNAAKRPSGQSTSPMRPAVADKPSEINPLRSGGSSTRRAGDRLQRELPLMRVFAQRPGVVVPSAARRRIMDAIGEMAQAGGSINVSGLTDAQWAAADLAEVKRRGNGIALIRDILAGATGPPKVASGG